MLRQHHETELDRPMAESFNALVNVVARGRWAAKLSLEPPETLPRSGMCYEQQRGSVLRRGRVIECIRPVSITLHETLLDPPCRVELRLRWRLEPVEAGSRLRLDASFELNGAASFRKRHWSSRIRGHCSRMIEALVQSLAARSAERAADADQQLLDQDNGVSGQKIGSTSNAVANVTRVNGRPTFR